MTKRTKQLELLDHPAFPLLLELHRADGLGSQRQEPDGSINSEKATFADVERLWVAHQSQPPEVQKPSLKDIGIDGGWVIKTLGIRPSPLVGQILAALTDSYINDEITDLAVLEQHARTFLPPDPARD